MVTRASTDLLEFPVLLVKKDHRDHPESQATRETKVAEESRARRVQLARKGKMVCRGLTGKMAHLVFLESRVPPASPVCPVLLVLREQQGCPAVLDPKVDLELREKVDLEVTLVCKVPPDLWVSLVFLVRLVWREYLDLRVTGASGDQSGPREESANL